MSEVQRLCDDIAVIHEGTVRAHGSVEDLLRQTGQSSLEKAFLQLVEFKSATFAGSTS
jgi:ABC-type Na+ transport system ATPase subunit NatA